MNKKVLAAVLTLGVILSIGYLGTNYVLAEDNNPMHQTLISKIAQKFNLKENDVEAVFEAVRDERREEMKSQKAERLSQAVKDGVITQSQKEAIIKMMQDNQAARFAHREEMQKWMADQGIDHTKLQNYLRPENRDEDRGMGMMGR